MLSHPVSGAGASEGNIVGVGIGPKINDGIVSEVEAVKVYVRVKIPKNQLTEAEEIPSEFNGIPTDVVEVGLIRTSALLKTSQRFGKHRPTSCGVSVGHPNITAGTLGCLVEKGNHHYILSNNHVLADCNDAKINDDIIQPGKLDGGTAADVIAKLSDFKPIDYKGATNDIDAAIAKVGTKSQTLVEIPIIDIGRPKTTTKKAALYQSVRKHGRTTGHTVGVVMDVSADIWVDYSDPGKPRKAWFEDQIMIEGVGSKKFSDGGDSGSLIVDVVTLKPVALLFAGGATQTFANPIDKVLNYFGVKIAS